MIIIDMNQITVASLMMHLNMTKSKEPDENIVRHMILNSVRMYRTQFTEEYGEVCLLYTSPSPRDSDSSRMPSSA